MPYSGQTIPRQRFNVFLTYVSSSECEIDMSGATSASQLLDLQHSKWILDLLGPVKAAALTYPHTATCHTAATQQPLRKAKVTATAFGSVTWWVPVLCVPAPRSNKHVKTPNWYAEPLWSARPAAKIQRIPSSKISASSSECEIMTCPEQHPRESLWRATARYFET